MNVNQLKYLRAVIAEGSYAGAARALFVSPQAVSKSLKALQAELPFALFKCKGRSITPTDDAVRFSDQAQDAVRSFDDLAYYVSGYSEEGGGRDIHLGVVQAASRCQVLFPEDFACYREQNRRDRLHLTFLGNEMCAAALLSEMLDVAIMLGAAEGDDVENRRICMLHPRAIMADEHELANRSRLLLDDLDRRPTALPLDRGWSAPRLIEGCRRRGVMPLFADLAPSREAAIGFVRQGGIVLAVREGRTLPLPSGMVALPFDPGERFAVPLTMVYRAKRSKAFAPLYTYAATAARKLLLEGRTR